MIENKTPQHSLWRSVASFVLVTAALVAIAGYIGGGALIHNDGFVDQMVLCPNFFTESFDISFPGIKRQTLSIPTRDGQKLDAWLFAVPGAKKLVIVNHGNAGNLSSRGFVVQALIQSKTNVLLYDYRGYGKSTGVATVHGLLEDAETVYLYARHKLGYSAGKIIEYGESIGSAAACRVAAQENCAALMLFAPIDSLPSAGRWTIPILCLYPDFCFAEKLDNVGLVKKIHSPVFIIHGKRDATLSAEGSQRLYDAAHLPKTLVYLPESDHSQMSAADGATYLRSIASFLSALPSR